MTVQVSGVKGENGPDNNPFVSKQHSSDQKGSSGGRVHTEQEFAKTAEGISDEELAEVNPFENAVSRSNSYVQQMTEPLRKSR